MGSGVQGHRAVVRDEPDAADDHRRPAPRRARLPRRPDGADLRRLPRRPLPARPRRGRRATYDEVAKFSAARRRRASPTTRPGCTASPTCSPRCCCARRRASARAGPGDLLDQLRMAWGMRGLDVRGTAEATRLFTMSIADVLDEWFESPEVKGVLAINGIIGTWAGPGGARHRVRDDAPHDRRRRRRSARLVGLPDRRHGRGHGRHPPLRRVVRRRGAHVVAGRAHRRHRRPGARRHDRATGGCCGRRSSSPPPTRRSRSCARSTRPSCRPTSSPTSSRWRSRSGTVKVNVALSELPDFLAWPGTEPHERFTGSVELCHSLDYLERAFQDAREGPAAASGRSPTASSRPRSTRRSPRTAPTSCRCSPSGCRNVVRRAAPRRAGAVRRPGHRRLHRAGARTSSSRSSTAR